MSASSELSEKYVFPQGLCLLKQNAVVWLAHSVLCEKSQLSSSATQSETGK